MDCKGIQKKIVIKLEMNRWIKLLFCKSLKMADKTYPNKPVMLEKTLNILLLAAFSLIIKKYSEQSKSCQCVNLSKHLPLKFLH